MGNNSDFPGSTASPFDQVDHSMTVGMYINDAIRGAIRAASPQPPAPTQAEPVAWMRPDNRVAEESTARTQFSRGAQKPPIGTWVPLYATPPAPASEAPTRDAEAELNCAEEILDAYAAQLPLEKTGFDCLGDYVKAVVAAVESPASTWLEWVATDGYRTDAERAAAKTLLSILPFRAAPTQAGGCQAIGEAVERLKFELRQVMLDYGAAERANDPERIRETSSRGVALIDSLAPIAAPPAGRTLTADKLWPVDGLYPDMEPPATRRDRWMFDQGRLAEARTTAGRTLTELERYLNDVVSNGTANERAVASTALRLLAASSTTAGTQPSEGE